MELKYRQLIADQNLSITCPPDDCQLNTPVEAARWVLSPIDHELNFLPNHLFNQKRGRLLRIQDEARNCGYCSVSLHESVEASENAFRGLSLAIRGKIGYTHIATGLIEAGIGLVTAINPVSRHFELFESDNYQWSNNFTIIAPLQ